MKLSQALCVAAAAIAFSAAYAQAPSMSMPIDSKPAASANTSAMPLVDAQVKKVDTAKGFIVLNHWDIPNIGMPAMTMGFDVADKKMLKGIKAGQKVKFQAAMVDGKATVTELKPAR